MDKLTAFIKSAVVRELRNSGEDPGDYDMEAIINQAAIERGHIVRDFVWATDHDGMTNAAAYEKLAKKYQPHSPEGIRTIIRRHKKRSTMTIDKK